MTSLMGSTQKRLYLIASLVLLVGLGGSIIVYLTAENDPGTALGYVIQDTQISDYPEERH